MIQDIYPRIYHNEYHDLTPKEEDFILVFHKNKVLVRFQEGKLRYPSLQEFDCPGPGQKYFPLFVFHR